MSEDMRSSIQRLLNRTRWEPFSYVSDGNVVLRRPGLFYRDAAITTTAIISLMIHTVNREIAQAKMRANREKGNE